MIGPSCRRFLMKTFPRWIKHEVETHLEIPIKCTSTWPTSGEQWMRTQLVKWSKAGTNNIHILKLEQMIPNTFKAGEYEDSVWT